MGHSLAMTSPDTNAPAVPRMRTSVIISVVDQAMLSAANLLLGIFLIRHSSKEEYGAYVLGYAIILFLVGIQNALVSSQMAVLAPSRSASEQGRFCSALAVGQFAIFVPLALIGLVVGLALKGAGHAGAGMAFAISVSLLGVVLREFFRSYFFLRLQPMRVLWLDIAFVTLLFTGLWAAVILQIPQINQAALVIMGLASLIVGIAATVMARRELPVRPADIRPAMQESWQHGRWALGGVTVTWIQDQSYIYLLSALVSTAETAEASAARLFLAPLLLLNAGFSRVLVPRWAYLAHAGKHDEIETVAKKVQWVLLLVIFGYVGFLLLVKDWLIPIVLTGAYTQTASLILLWGILFAIQSMRGNYSSLLQVFKRFREITLANSATAIGVLLMGVVLIKAYGVKGSLMTLIIGEAVLTLLLANGIRHVRKAHAY